MSRVQIKETIREGAGLFTDLLKIMIGSSQTLLGNILPTSPQEPESTKNKSSL